VYSVVLLTVITGVVVHAIVGKVVPGVWGPGGLVAVVTAVVPVVVVFPVGRQMTIFTSFRLGSSANVISTRDPGVGDDKFIGGEPNVSENTTLPD
jgi:hypothetical protein